ncbi:hypothetical protein GCM10007916_10070 [Psychromonas marina]|uniref:Uncharacterized protein n=1 Tax=Psychromonas marina TaxID=88364 RepID=A0ABQ6DYB5_9GAMM|nr:hypothetical protein [Psychromonas marina]GLS89940.1 hypothetical protein GCM10007916_10070 [Psychromonas marina]
MGIFNITSFTNNLILPHDGELGQILNELCYEGMSNNNAIYQNLEAAYDECYFQVIESDMFDDVEDFSYELRSKLLTSIVEFLSEFPSKRILSALEVRGLVVAIISNVAN